MHLDIYSDTICPWCYIGKRRLERALAERPQDGLPLRWRAFQLNPDMPAGGMERQRYLELKFGGPANARTIYDRIREAGEEEAIPFAFEAIRRTPNTVDSHRLIRFATQHGGIGQESADAVVNALFEAYFLRGEDIGDLDLLCDLAGIAGLDPMDVRVFLESEAGTEAVRAEDAQARAIGIQGVPTFILDGKYVLSGAHPPEVLFQFFDLAKHGEPAAAD
jgi:predicted DsbA family dithiol-disulfide isomerase